MTIIDKYHQAKQQQLFDRVYQIRQDFYEAHIGQLPDDIQKFGIFLGYGRGADCLPFLPISWAVVYGCIVALA